MVVIPEPARSDRRGVVIGISLAAVLAIAVGIVSLDESTTRAPSAEQVAVDAHGTRPPPLDSDAITRAALGFGITHAPERRATGWEAEDRVRSLYLTESPSAWYVLYENSSVLLGPVADRQQVCSRADAPADCAVPGTAFLAETTARPPDAATAAHAARTMLTRAGMLDGSWHLRVLDAGTGRATVPGRAPDGGRLHPPEDPDARGDADARLRPGHDRCPVGRDRRASGHRAVR